MNRSLSLRGARRGPSSGARWAVALQVVLLAALGVVWIYPFLWLLSASLKGALEIFVSGLNLIPQEWQWSNYARAWDDAGFSGYMLNSVIVTVACVLIVVIRCALTGYVLARYNFIGKRLLLGIFVATIFVPAGYTIIAVVELSNRLGLLNSHLGIILALSGGGHVAAVLLYAGYFSRIPRELEEAAVLDGASFLQVFRTVMLPLAGPVTATVSILTFLTTWNAFFVPLVFTFSRPDLRTLAVGMLAFRGEHSTDWSGLAAAATISLIPVALLFLFLQRYFIEGVAGAVKS
ncbi:MAG: carbohydrate ABC transporter permease [Dehalococcoidia bacterium]